MKLLIFLTIILTSCASGQLMSVNPVIDKRLQPYVDNFIKDSNGLLTKNDLNFMKIRFIKFKKTLNRQRIVGWCKPIFYKRIEIDQDYWNMSTHYEKEALVYHELGHCVLYRQHTMVASNPSTIWGYIRKILISLHLLPKPKDIYFDDQCPKSYMYPYTIKDPCIRKHRKEYINELFHWKNK